MYTELSPISKQNNVLRAVFLISLHWDMMRRLLPPTIIVLCMQ